ncbi:MAG TPA: TetR/AcrR family transcriptional regulator [Solirubrobacterales bacterium]|nr:TetR/AcrR family transcriptional regulator [Solirubrobacterales bacterium]
MGRQGVVKVQPGGEGAGSTNAVDPSAETGKLGGSESPKREKILVGILEEVGANGYEATSVRTVLARTGLYRQAFYDNFPDKDACFQHAFEAGVARLEALAGAAAAGRGEWRSKLRAGLAAVLEFLDAEPEIGRALIVEVHAAGPEPLRRRAETMKKITDFIDLARYEAEGDERPPNLAPEGIIAGIHAIVHSRLSTGAKSGFRGLLPEFMYFAVLPYFGAAAAAEEMRTARTELERASA